MFRNEAICVPYTDEVLTDDVRATFVPLTSTTISSTALRHALDAIDRIIDPVPPETGCSVAADVLD